MLRWLKLAAVLTLWAGSFVLNDVALRDLGTATIVAGRWLITAGLILALVVRRGQSGQLRQGLRHDGLRFFLLSLVGVTLLYGLQVAGQTRTSAVNTGLLSNAVPMFTALLAMIFLGERLRAFGWLGIVIALVGAWIVSAGGLRLQFDPDSAVGDLLVLMSALMAALYFVVGKGLLERYSALVVTAAAATLGAATLLPLALLEDTWREMTWPAAAAVIVLGIGPGLLSNLWWWETAEWLDASRAAMYVYLIPLIATIFAVVFLHETVSPAQLLGVLLVLSGVWLAERATTNDVKQKVPVT